MQRNIVWTVLVLTLAAGIAPAAAQPTGNDWDVAIAPYLMGAAMTRTTTVPDLEADDDIPASEIFSNLQFGAMGMS